MNTNDLNFFKKLILEKRQKVQEYLSLHNSNNNNEDYVKMMEDSKYSSHMAEVASDTQALEHNLYFISRKRKYLKHLNAALQRIENNEYGICVRCGQMISRARLEVVPHTQHCVPCKNNPDIVD